MNKRISSMKMPSIEDVEQLIQDNNKRQVSFEAQTQATGTVRGDRDEQNTGESREEMLRKVKDLKQHAREVERRVPLLSLQKNDEMLQLKYFIITYYLPILSVYELSTLKNSCGDLLDSVIDKAKQRQY